jgi:hypothetical protein
MVTSSAFSPPFYRFEKRVTELEIEGIRLKIIKIPYSNNLLFWKRILAFIKFPFFSTLEASSIPVGLTYDCKLTHSVDRSSYPN